MKEPLKGKKGGFLDTDDAKVQRRERVGQTWPRRTGGGVGEPRLTNEAAGMGFKSIALCRIDAFWLIPHFLLMLSFAMSLHYSYLRQ